MKNYELRKFFHIACGILLFLLYHYLNQQLFQIFSLLLIFAILIAYSLNVFRMRLFSEMFHLLRKKDEYLGEGLLFLLSSFLLGSILLDRSWFYALSTMIIFGDGLATIIGRNFGKTKLFYSSKTAEGTFAYFAFSLPALLFVQSPWFFAVIVISTIIESIDFIEDNTSLAVFLVVARRFFA